MKPAIDSKTLTARGLIAGVSFAFLLTIASITLAIRSRKVKAAWTQQGEDGIPAPA